MPQTLLEHPNVPRYVKLAEELGAQMASGQLKPGDRLPSFAEMKARYGVSQNTLERVHGVLEKQGLIVREQGRGTFVAGRESRPRRALLGTIGITGEGFSFQSQSSYWAKLLHGIRKAADEGQMQVLILDHLSTNGWHKADGVLIASWDFERIRLKAPADMPYVSVMTPQNDATCVVVDDHQCGHLATQYLMEHGHRRIAFLISKDQVVMPARIGGYMDALESKGIYAEARWQRKLLTPYFDGADFRTSGRNTVAQWLKDGWGELGCTALLCQNDDCAIGAIEAFTAAGVRVPEDVSVMGFDGTEICDYFQPQLTSVKLPLEQIGATAVRKLMGLIENERAALETIKLPTEIKAGSTVGPVPA